jgi:3D (Asp-Asp-Asp) domain-containing protein
MVINVPLVIDEASIEGRLKIDYEKKVIESVEKQIKQTLKGRYGWGDADEGMREIINRRVDVYIDNHRDEVLDEVAKRIYERSVRTKKVRTSVEAANE